MREVFLFPFRIEKEEKGRELSMRERERDGGRENGREKGRERGKKQSCKEGPKHVNFILRFFFI